MKSYDELTNDLLERRDQYVSAQRKKRKSIIGVSASVCSCCLIFLLCFSLWNMGMFEPAPPDQVLEDTLYPGIKDYFDDLNGESLDDPSANNKIIIHSIDGVSSGTMNISLKRNDFVEMTRDEMIAYYGIDYIPEVPADIKLTESPIGIYRRNGGTGEVYWDQDDLSYSNEDITRAVGLQVNKGRNVFVDCFYFEGTEELSVINNIEMFIGKSENSYYAEFMYNDIGVLLTSKGLTEEEFISILISIIE